MSTNASCIVTIRLDANYLIILPGFVSFYSRPRTEIEILKGLLTWIDIVIGAKDALPSGAPNRQSFQYASQVEVFEIGSLYRVKTTPGARFPTTTYWLIYTAQNKQGGSY